MVLTNIDIKNYKRIKDPGIELKELTKVNYLLGENGSGKSSTLRYIFDNNQDAMFIVDSLSDLNNLLHYPFDINKKELNEYWKQVYLYFLVEERTAILDLLGYSSVLEKTQDDWNIVDEEVLFDVFEILELSNALDVQTNLIESDVNAIDQDFLLAGDNKIINLVYSIISAHKKYNKNLFLIEEPATHLHPKWQKRIPIVLDFISNNYGLQFFLSSHSPFIISKVGEITEGNIPSQKIYFLKDGKVAGKRGTISNKGKTGYWGKKVNFISSKMLGAGLMDLASPQRSIEPNKNTPILVLCEGEGSQEDAKVYNTIFNDYERPVMFISSRGSSQLYKTYEILQEIKPALSSDFELLMIRDRDHEFKNNEAIKSYEEGHDCVKILHRRALESYIYNTETAELLLNKFNKKLNNDEKEEMKNAEMKIGFEVANGIPGNSYKQLLYNTFSKITRGFLVEYKKNEIRNPMEKIATLITPKTVAYKELEKIIFS